jgi:predicted  nucleic acid-binding Zn-ribbon protein
METTCSHLYLPDKYKEENWNLEVTLQELRIQFSDSQSTVQRLEGEHKRLTRQFNKAREATDQHKNEAERLKNGLEELKANHETAIAQARRQAASLQRDKSDLQQSVDSMKAEMARLNRRLPRMGSPMTPERSDLLTPHDREISDVFSTAPSTSRRRGDTSTVFSADGEYDSSPDVSPSRPFQAPNHPSNEVEALHQRLAHAQRQINTLKSTLQREKELKIEYRKRLDASPNVSVSDLNTEEFVTDDDTEDGTPGTGKHPRRLGSFRVGRGGRGRGRGRGGITLIQRLEHAARSPPSDFEEDEDFGVITSTPPPPPTLPVFFGGGAEADDEPEPDYPDEEPVAEPPSNRGSLDGLDPAFANVLRRSSSSGSLPYNRSPLRQAVVSRTLPRRSRGGAAFQEARPASLVGQPEALAAELFGTGMDSVAEAETVVETAEFGCQTELEVVTSELPPPIQITPAAPENADFGVQVDPEVPETKLMVDTPTQTDPEPILRPEPKVVVERADTGVQHEPIEVPRFYAESSIETDPIVEHQTIPIALPASLPVTLQAGIQTLSIQTTDLLSRLCRSLFWRKSKSRCRQRTVPSSSAHAFDTGGDADSASVLNDTIRTA